jgi:AcrR family transcriptional regulator
VLDEANDVQAPDRRTARRAATQGEIIEAAWALVRERGLAALSLRDLAARVGMRAPSLYQYFPSKHAIYDAMFEEGAREALAQVPLTDALGSDAREALRTAAHKFFDFATSDPARAQLLFMRTIPGFEPSQHAYAPAVALIDALAAFLAHFGITDPDAVDLWTAMTAGLIMQQLANDPGGDRWGRLIDRSVDRYLADMLPSKRKAAK